VSAMVVYKGPVLPILTKLMEGVRSGCSYQGAKTLVELKRNPEFVLISGAGLVESHPHDVVHPG
jgi:IMP dehydrogenase